MPLDTDALLTFDVQVARGDDVRAFAVTPAKWPGSWTLWFTPDPPGLPELAVCLDATVVLAFRDRCEAEIDRLKAAGYLETARSTPAPQAPRHP